jgi:hypothetical protein
VRLIGVAGGRGERAKVGACVAGGVRELGDDARGLLAAPRQPLQALRILALDAVGDDQLGVGTALVVLGVRGSSLVSSASNSPG